MTLVYVHALQIERDRVTCVMNLTAFKHHHPLFLCEFLRGIRCISDALPRFNADEWGAWLCPNAQVWKTIVVHRKNSACLTAHEAHFPRFEIFENQGVIVKQVFMQ